MEIESTRTTARRNSARLSYLRLLPAARLLAVGGGGASLRICTPRGNNAELCIAIDLFLSSTPSGCSLRRSARPAAGRWGAAGMRHPRMAYSFLCVEESRLPHEITGDERVRIARRGSPSLAVYLRICRQMVPNVHHEEVVLGDRACPFTLVLLHRGVVVGGVTFRMLIAEPIIMPGMPKKNVPPAQLIVDIQLLAIAGPHHGRGFGRQLVTHVRRAARAQAREKGLAHIFFLVQADNGALPFWRHTGFAEDKAAMRVATQLSRWRPFDNVMYKGATPLGVRERLLDYCGAPVSTAPKGRCKRPRTEDSRERSCTAAPDLEMLPRPLAESHLQLVTSVSPSLGSTGILHRPASCSGDSSSTSSLSPVDALLASPSPTISLAQSESPQSPDIAALAACSALAVGKIASCGARWSLPPLYVRLPAASCAMHASVREPVAAAPASSSTCTCSDGDGSRSGTKQQHYSADSICSAYSVPPPPPSPRECGSSAKPPPRRVPGTSASEENRHPGNSVMQALRQPSLDSDASDGSQVSKPETITGSMHSDPPRLPPKRPRIDVDVLASRCGASMEPPSAPTHFKIRIPLPQHACIRSTVCDDSSAAPAVLSLASTGAASGCLSSAASASRCLSSVASVCDAMSDAANAEIECPSGGAPSDFAVNDDAHEWCCERCTLMNEDWRKKCLLCMKNRPGLLSKPLPRMLMELSSR